MNGLYRGKSVEHDRLVVGYYVATHKDSYIIEPQLDLDEEDLRYFLGAYIHQIYPESLERGVPMLRDKNGKPFFANDLVRTKRGTARVVDTGVSMRLVLEGGDLRRHVSWNYASSYEIIGRAEDG